MTTAENQRAQYREYLKEYYFDLMAKEEQLLKDTGQFIAELGTLIADGPNPKPQDEIRLVA